MLPLLGPCYIYCLLVTRSESILDSKPDETRISASTRTSVPEGYVLVANSALYHGVQGVVAEPELFKTGKDEGDGLDRDIWPTTDVPNDRPTVAQLRPNPKKSATLTYKERVEWEKRVARYVMSLSDLTADVLDFVCISWLESRPRSFDSMIVVKAPDFLELRGLRKREGKSGGFRVKQKKELEEQMTLLNNLWIRVLSEGEESSEDGNRVKNKFLRSPAIVLSSEIGEQDEDGYERVYAWRTRPGDVFIPSLIGPGRVLAPLTKRALQFDPYRNKLEKRLTRYLTWIWRIRQSSGSYNQPFSVSTLLESTRTPLDKKRPSRTRDRFELALDNLKDSDIIADWSYTEGTDYDLTNRGWGTKWLTQAVVVQPPEAVLNFLERSLPSRMLRRPREPIVRKEPSIDPLIAEMKRVRQSNRRTQPQLAEQLNISAMYVSQLERGVKSPSKKLSNQIRGWIDVHSSPMLFE